MKKQDWLYVTIEDNKDINNVMFYRVHFV